MSGTCAAPSGDPVYSFGLKTSTIMIWFTVLAFAPLTLLLLGPRLLFWIFGSLGLYLRRKTEGRRAQILELVDNEEKEWETKGKSRSDSDEGEEVDAITVGTAEDG